MYNYTIPKRIPEIKLSIHKPNGQKVGNLKKVFGIRLALKLGQINELNFTVPIQYVKDGQLVKNPDVKKLKPLYKIKAKMDGMEFQFVISNLDNKVDRQKKSQLNVQAMSLPYQLRTKKIREWPGIFINGDFQKEALNAKQVLDDILSTTTWASGYIDSEFITDKFRNFDFTNTSVLDAVFRIAETFKATVIWDEKNKKINLYKPENVGTFKGFRISERKYLSSIGKEIKADEVVTRLRIYGQDGLSINRVNPTGTDYLEDYSYYMRGFQRDANKNVISSSDGYMSDGLCSALLDYQDLTKSKQGEFQNLLNENDRLVKQHQTLENTLRQKETELKKVDDLKYVKHTSGQDISQELIREAALKADISSLNSQMSSLSSQIQTNENAMSSLQLLLSMEQNFTKEQLLELDEYTHYETWEDSNYFDDEELYKDGKKVFVEMTRPKELYKMDIVNFLSLTEGEKDWDKLRLGDKFNIHYELFDTNIETQLTEYEIDFDSRSINITTGATRDIKSGQEKFEDRLKNIIGSTKSYDMSKFRYDQINKINTMVDEIYNGNIDAAKNSLLSGFNNSVVIDRRGITNTSSDDPLRFIRINNGVIGLTNDGGNSFKTAITAEGVTAETIVGKLLISKHLYIENASGLYTFDQNGFSIVEGALNIKGGLGRNHLNPNFADSLLEINKNYTNGIRLDAAQGLVVTRSDDRFKSIFNATDGMKFQVKEGGVWRDKLYYDIVSGTLTVNGTGNFGELKVNGVSVLTVDKQKISGNSIDKISTDQLVVGNAKIGTAMIERLVVGENVIMSPNAYISWGQISDQPYIPRNASDIGAVSESSPRLTYIDAYGVYTGRLSADQIQAGSINANLITAGSMSADRVKGGILSLSNGSSIRMEQYGGYGNMVFTSGAFSFEDASEIDFNNIPVRNLRATAKFA